MEKDPKRAKEIEQKISEVRQIIDSQNLRGILLTQQYNLYWLAAGGNNHVLWDDQNSLIGILVTKDKAVVIAENGDIRRVGDEEFLNYPFEYLKYEWYASNHANESLKVAGNGRFGTDVYNPVFSDQINVNPFLSEYRSVFQPYEAERYIKHGREVAAIITDVVKASEPGIRENEIAAMFANECIKKGFTIFVQLLGGDERSLKYRHQVVTDKKISSYYCFCGVGRFQGFTYPINRVVSFGEPDKTLVENNKKIETVYALLNANAKIGINLREIYKRLPDIYESAGVDRGEWRNHSIGGITGYLSRENQLMNGVNYVIRENNMIGWNPSLPGNMAEDVYIRKKDEL
ncbi:MAG: M24 family metallopeptidase, partial [Candidatus Humimicrobiaceae bacterium]